MNLKISIFLVLLFTTSLIYSQNYTWLKGSNTSGISGTYGTMGVSNLANNPGGRHGSATWIDASGNLWLFGGEGYSANNTVSWLNDLWKFDISTKEWTWIRGSNVANQIGAYGTQGVASSTNEPGAREFSVTWKDAAGNFYMFGGDGFANNATFGRLGDLWKYNPTANTWTWLRGFNTVNQNGNYGTQGVASLSNDPGARFGSAAFSDAAGNFWMFGGRGFPSAGFGGFLNDLWKYNVSTNEWTWVNGTNVTGTAGTYGTLNVSSPSNSPGAAEFPSFWQDATGMFYLFGGRSTGYFGDLWKYNPATNIWTWINGPNISNQLGVYGVVGVSAPSNSPGGRFAGASWVDLSGNLWMFGGQGWSNASLNQLNDLWKYNTTTNQWTWMKGANSVNQNGVYGALGITSPLSTPGARFYNNWWRDLHAEFWLFGGEGYDINANSIDHMNDLWKYIPPCSPDSIVSIPGKTICSGNSLTLTAANQYPSNVYWYNSPSSSATIATGSVLQTGTLTTIASPSVFTYYAEANSCTVTPRTSISITVNPLPIISINGPTVACSGDNVLISATGANSYTWNVGANSPTLNVLAMVPSFVNIVVGTDGNGCESSTSHTTIVNATPTVSISSSTPSICVGESLTLTAIGANTYSWNFGQTSSSVAISPINTTTYNVVGTSTNGCQNNALQIISVYMTPTVNVTSTQSVICKGETVTLTASGAASYAWDFGPTTASIVTSPTINTTYTVIGTTNGCSSSTIIAAKVLFCLGINNLEQIAKNRIIISPNPTTGDFYLRIEDLKENADLVITNILGQIVFEQKISILESHIKTELIKGVYNVSLLQASKELGKAKLIVD